MKRFAQTLLYSVLAALCASPELAKAQETKLRQFDVVPPVWITPDGDPDHHGEDGGNTGGVAYIFPSLPPMPAAPDMDRVLLPNIFQPNNRFKAPQFEWSVDRDIKIDVSRTGNDANIHIASESMGHIRKLKWEPFQQLQGAFKDWLYRHSNCWFFGDCESRFTPEFHHQLIVLWKHVLQDATFERFSADYLNPPPPAPIQYFSTATQPLPIDSNETRMFVTEIAPSQILSVTWGGEDVYPGGSGTSTSYSRSTSVGNSRVQIVSERGMRLFPAEVCGAASIGQQENEVDDKKVLIPYPNAWKGLLGKEFIPIYNLFDLHNLHLLQGKSAPAAPDCQPHEDLTPKHFFLLSPASYMKADEGLRGPIAIAQFENEARSGKDSNARDQLNMLARQFVVMGCNSSSISDVKLEWNRFLEVAYAALVSQPLPATTTSCSSFVHGVFSGKTYVELRNHFNVNGHPMDDGALNSATVGQAVAASLGTRLNLEGRPASGSLVELWRFSPPRSKSLESRAIQIRFHTTMSGVLDWAGIVEGDEIYGSAISEILR